jgi:uncharacterized membrane protein (DUF485 family)
MFIAISYVHGTARHKLEESKPSLGISKSSLAGQFMPSIWTSSRPPQIGLLRAIYKRGLTMNPQSGNGSDEMGSLALGLGLSVAMAICFFIFIGLGAFFPHALSAPAFASHPASIGLVWGFGLILLSALTTLVYAFQANLAARRVER